MSNPLNTCNTVDLLENSSVFTAEIDKFQAKEEFEYKNLKKILLIVEKSDFLSAKNEELLRNIVKSIKLNWDDISVLTLLSSDRMTLGNLIYNNDIEHVVIFGLSPSDMGLNIDFPINRVIRLRGCQLSHTFKLEDLDCTKAKKAALWNTLQAQFKISA